MKRAKMYFCSLNVKLFLIGLKLSEFLELSDNIRLRYRRCLMNEPQTWSQPWSLLAPLACLPDISTTLSDDADGNFSFSTFVMRTSPSVCVDRPLCSCLKTTWKTSRCQALASRDRLASPQLHFKVCLLHSFEEPGAQTAPGRSNPANKSAWPECGVGVFMGRLVNFNVQCLVNKSCPPTASSQEYDVTHPGTWMDTFLMFNKKAKI